MRYNVRIIYLAAKVYGPLQHKKKNMIILAIFLSSRQYRVHNLRSFNMQVDTQYLIVFLSSTVTIYNGLDKKRT